MGLRLWAGGGCFHVFDSEIQISPYRFEGRKTRDHSGTVRGVFVVITTEVNTERVKWVNLEYGHKKIILNCGELPWIGYKKIVEDLIISLTRED